MDAPQTSEQRATRQREHAIEPRAEACGSENTEINVEVNSDLDISPRERAGAAFSSIQASASRGGRKKKGGLELLSQAISYGAFTIFWKVNSVVISIACQDFSKHYAQMKKRFLRWSWMKKFDGDTARHWINMGDNAALKKILVEDWEVGWKALNG